MNRYRSFSILIIGMVALISVVDMLKHPQGPLPEILPVLTTQAEKHILNGDARGGGHLHGTGNACKSEFPAAWDEQDVIAHVKDIAANDNLNWKEQSNGYHVAESMVENVRVRVVINQDQTKIVTAYPTNLPRNPCPKPANDN